MPPLLFGYARDNNIDTIITVQLLQEARLMYNHLRAVLPPMRTRPSDKSTSTLQPTHTLPNALVESNKGTFLSL